MAKNTNVDMLHGPLQKNIILYTLPIIATSVLHLLFNTADLLVVGQYCDSLAVGAIGSTSSITTLLVNAFIGLSVGVSVTVAQGLGAGHPERVERIVHTAMPLAAIFGLFLTVIGVLFAKPLLTLMGNPPETIGLATLYMRIYFCGMTANLVYNFGGAILRAAGDTVRPLIFLTAAGVLNVLLNLIFVIGFGMSVDGVAIATAASQVLSAVLVVIALCRRTDACRLRLKKIKIHWRSMKQIFYIGVPASIQSSMFSIANVIIQSSVNSFGAVAVTGGAAASTVEGYVYVCINAFYQASMNFTGQNMGAGNVKRINRILWLCILDAFAVGAALGGLVNLFARPLLGLFITDSPEAIAFGMIKLIMIGLPYFLCGMQDVVTGVLRGMGFSISTMCISIVGICGVRLLWIFTVFQKFHTPAVLFASYAISWTITGLAGLAVFYANRKKILRPQEALSTK